MRAAVPDQQSGHGKGGAKSIGKVASVVPVIDAGKVKPRKTDMIQAVSSGSGNVESDSRTWLTVPDRDMLNLTTTLPVAAGFKTARIQTRPYTVT